MKLLFLLVASVGTMAQTIGIADISDAASRTSLTGTATFAKQAVSCFLTATNRSNLALKDIAVLVKITRPDGQYSEFKFIHTHHVDRGVEPGKQMPIAVDACSDDYANNKTSTKNPASATAATIAVRYTDGTVWGDQKEFEDID